MLLTVKELAEQLHIKPATPYAWAAQHKIPFLKIHGVVRFESETIREWLQTFKSSRRDQRLTLRLPNRAGESVDALIARAKQAVYTSRRGNQTNSEPE